MHNDFNILSNSEELEINEILDAMFDPVLIQYYEKETKDKKKIKQIKKKLSKHVFKNVTDVIINVLDNERNLLEDENNYQKRLKELNKEKNLEYYFTPKISQFLAVDEWLYNELTKREEITFKYNNWFVWATEMEGTDAIYLDPVMQRIANEII